MWGLQSPHTYCNRERKTSPKGYTIVIGIYCIRHILSGKCYVGQSINIKRRIQEYSHQSRKPSMAIVAALEKYGAEAFEWEVLEVCAEDDLDDRECHWIASLDCISPKGYNLRSGGAYGRQSLSTRRKIGKAHKGKYVSESTRRKLSKINKGKKLSKEHKRKIRSAWWDKSAEIIAHYKQSKSVSETSRVLGCPATTIRRILKENNIIIKYDGAGKNNGFFGKKHTKESKEKVSKTKRGRAWEHSDEIIAHYIKTRNKLGTARHFGCSESTVRRIIESVGESNLKFYG